MVVGLCHGLVEGLDRVAVHGVRRRGGEVVRQRLRRAVEEDTDADASAEHHGDPAKAAELGFFVIRAELDAAQAREADVGHDEDREDHRDVEQPASVRNRPRERGRGDFGHGVRPDDAPDNEGDDEGGRGEEERLVEPEAVALVIDGNARDEARVHVVGGI